MAPALAILLLSLLCSAACAYRPPSRAAAEEHYTDFLRALEDSRTSGPMWPSFCMHDGAAAISNAIVHTYPSNPPTNLMCWVHFLRGGKKREADIIFLGRVSRNGQLVLEFNYCFVTAGNPNR